MADADARLSDFDYDLPPDRIAQEPARPRDSSRLMVMDRFSGRIEHRHFCDLPDILRPDDFLVLNDTRVIPAAFTALRASGSRIEGCFLRILDACGPGRTSACCQRPGETCLAPTQGETERRQTWEVLLAGRGRLRQGDMLHLVDPSGAPAQAIELVGRGEGGSWIVRPCDRHGEPAGIDAIDLLRRIGRTPLPPYIRRSPDDPRSPTDIQTYQTIYACRDGAVAAPTAGLHFTPEVFARLDKMGVERGSVTLHVGLGTFQPIRTEMLTEHRMHAELFEVSPDTAERINRARAAGRRIIAVGTTTVRALESAAGEPVVVKQIGGTGVSPVCLAVDHGHRRDAGATIVRAARAATNIFIYPPYRFRVVDGLLTNFHLPRTTLLAMVSALAGRERVLRAYAEAIREGYRFYSYGDAMLIV